MYSFVQIVFSLTCMDGGVTPRVKLGTKSLFGQRTIFGFFFCWLDTNTKRGEAVLTFLKSYPGDTDSKYIWIHGYSYIGPTVLEVPFFLAF